jgi:hypothetical protein
VSRRACAGGAAPRIFIYDSGNQSRKDSRQAPFRTRFD